MLRIFKIIYRVAFVAILFFEGFFCFNDIELSINYTVSNLID